MNNDLEPPPGILDLVTSTYDPKTERVVDKGRQDSQWKLWLNNLYEFVRGLVAEEVQKTAFGEQSVAELTSVANIQFPYNIHHDVIEERHNNGSVSAVDSMAVLSTGAAANQSASILSRVPIKYYSGIGGLVRFTTIYTTGVANSVQMHGIGDSGDGFFFGYNGADFGVLRKNNGNPEIRSIQITTKSSTAENITITLDGDSDTTVTVTNGVDATDTANEIAAHDFSHLGRGWLSRAEGDTVYFQSFNSSSRVGTYSLSGTTAVGSAAQVLAGVSPTDTWVKQSDWSENTMTGLDQTKGNVYQIRYQWLGFGMITFSIEDAETGSFKAVHKIKYANTSIIPSIQNPTLPICMMCENTTNTSDMVIKTSSMAGFLEGKKPDAVSKNVKLIDVTLTSTTLVPIMTLLNDELFQGKLNRVRIKITSISVEVESGKPVVIELVRRPVLIGASFSSFNTAESVTAIDTTATATSGGEILDGGTVASGASFERFPNQYIEPNETMALVGAQASSGTNSVCKVIVNWEEDF